jgi:Asp-tRNA(Asn)/Glu-tRNA(Gln) amidotransferase A subunit family amidase
MPEPLPIADVRARLDAAPQRLEAFVDDLIATARRADEQVHAWSELDIPGATSAAATLVEAGWRPDPLWGVPLGVKDIIDVAGMATRAGAQKNPPRTPAASDAGVVHALRRRGMIVLGKTVTAEFAWFTPTATRNPRVPDRSPGGSSSGSAAAVAAGMCSVALGTQTAGSLMRPAAFCGVVAIKPSHGLVSLAGVIPVAPSLDVVGTFATCVKDAATVLTAMSYGADGDRAPAPPRTRRPRIAVLRDYFWDVGDPEVLEGAELAIARLADEGAEITTAVLPPGFNRAHDTHQTIMLAEMAWHRRHQLEADPEVFSDALQADIVRGLQFESEEYLAARRAQGAFSLAMDRTARQFDALLTPVSRTLPTPRDSTGDPAFHIPFTLAGLPTVALPSGSTEHGTPLGIQLIGHWGSDLELAATASWVEQVLTDRGGEPRHRLSERTPEVQT